MPVSSSVPTFIDVAVAGDPSIALRCCALPVAYVVAGINKRYWFYLLVSLPTLAVCLLSSSDHYISDSRMYMLPLVPFLMLMVVKARPFWFGCLANSNHKWLCVLGRFKLAIFFFIWLDSYRL